MAMNKAEMEACHHKYNALMKDAKKAKQDGLYHLAIEKALLSWGYVDGMMQYERRYNKREFNSVATIDLILKYSPLLFDFESLDKLECLINETRRIEKNTNDCIGDKLVTAISSMWEYRRLWDYLEQNTNVRQDELHSKLGGDPAIWGAAIEHWERMKLIDRQSENTSYRISLSTRMGEIVSAKCPACGNTTEAPKAMLLEETPCPNCNREVEFTILSKTTTSNME